MKHLGGDVVSTTGLEPVIGESFGVNTSAVNLYAQDFRWHVGAEMIQERESAGFVRGLEHDHIQSKCFRKEIGDISGE